MKFNRWCAIALIGALILAVAENHLGPTTSIFQLACFFFGICFTVSAQFIRKDPSKMGLGLCLLVAAFVIVVYRIVFGPLIYVLPPVPATQENKPRASFLKEDIAKQDIYVAMCQTLNPQT